MRCLLLAGILLVLPGVCGSARAQRILYIPKNGYGERVVFLGDLPPRARAVVRAELQCEPRVGFMYWHCYVFNERFDLWTSGGKFVLYAGDGYWEVSRETLAELLGPDGATQLATPWTYWIPPGLATILVVVAACCIGGYLSARARANRLVKDTRFEAALEVYAQALPDDAEPTKEDKARALATGIDFLKDSGIAQEKAEASLRLLVGELEKGRSYDLRNQAVQYEQAGEWEEAIAYYEAAAELREDWDPKDHQFLLKCIDRVRTKQARSSK